MLSRTAIERWRIKAAAVLLCTYVARLSGVEAAAINGTITGTVTAHVSGAPIDNAEVMLDSPVQSVVLHTDQLGHFHDLTLLPQTYTMTVRAPGFDTQRVEQVVIGADTQAIETVRLDPAPLQEIGHIAVHARSAVLQPGVVADVSSISSTQQQAARLLGGGAKMNSVMSALDAAPGVFVPLGGANYQPQVYIRGGDFRQTGFELDGVPVSLSYDATSASPLSNLGAQEIQVYTGAAPIDQASEGIGGYVNEVIKSGTYPGFANLDLNLGMPSPSQNIRLEAGGANGPTRDFTYYVAVDGSKMQQRIDDQYNGASLAPKYGEITNVVAQDSNPAGCGANTGIAATHASAGCYVNNYASSQIGNLPLGPNGYVTANSLWGQVPTENEGDSIVNLHFALPNKRGGTKDDLQVLLAQSQYRYQPNSSLNDFGANQSDVLNGTVTTPGGILPSCMFDPNSGAITNFQNSGCALTGPVALTFPDQPLFSGPLGGILDSTQLNAINLVRYPGSTQAAGGSIPSSQSDSAAKQFALEKVALQHHINDRESANLTLYSMFSQVNELGLVSQYQPYFSDGLQSQYAFTNRTNGIDASLTDRISAAHTLRIDAAQAISSMNAYSNSYAQLQPGSPVAVLVNANAPLAGCYGQDPSNPTMDLVDCSTANSPSAAIPAASYVLPTAANIANGLTPGLNSPSLGQLSGLQCGSGPCAYQIVSDGENAAVSAVGTRFQNIDLEDRWKVSAPLFIDLGLRFDQFFYGTAHTGTPAEQLYANSYNATHCIAGTIITALTPGQTCGSLGGGNVATSINPNSGNLNYQNLEPRVGATYTLDPSTVLRFSIGRYLQPPQAASVQYETVQPSIPGASTYANLGFPSFTYPLYPASSTNIDFSWEHAVAGNPNAWKVTPFERTTKGELAYMPIDAKSSVFGIVNGLNRESKGVEVYWRNGNAAKNGITTQLAYTYTNTTATYPVLPSGGSFVSVINQALQQYNGYTKFCSTNPSDPRCPAGTSYAAPCYTNAVGSGANLISTGTPSTTCTSGMIANPYWNAQPASLLDPNARYPVFFGPAGLGAYGDSTSYSVPHTATFLVNYRHNRFVAIPSFQFEAGGQYGSPLAAQGVAPNSCAGAFAGNLTGDPRYPNGPPVGGEQASPYDASTCYQTVAIPDPNTNQFDGLGAFRQPSLLAMNLDLQYSLSKATTVNLSFANLMVRCFGGSQVAWSAGTQACNYRQAAPFVGNFYNPGDSIQPIAAYPYAPIVTDVNTSNTANAPFPLEVYLGVHFAL